MKFIRTTGYCNKHCLICKRKNRLKRILKQDICHAYRFHGIVIKEGVRCCYKHFDKTGFLKSAEYYKIPTSLSTADKLEKNTLKNIIEPDNCKSIFEKFRNIKQLSSQTCKEITGWSIEKFIEFSSFIKIKKTEGII